MSVTELFPRLVVGCLAFSVGAAACAMEVDLPASEDLATENDAFNGADQLPEVDGIDAPGGQFGGIPAGSAPASARPASVVRLADGDSGHFLVDGSEVEIRLLGYNAPERYEHDGDAEPGCNGAAATAALTDLLDEAQEVLVDVHETDRFGRSLADVWVDGRSVVDVLIATGRGLALEGGPNRAYMREAAEAQVGMWGAGCGQPAVSGLTIVDAEPNPPGRDEEDLNGEWVVLRNDGTTPIDLQGWDIRDDSSSHRFGLSGVVESGEELVVYNGRGASGGGELYLDTGTPVWSNKTDTVLVIDPDGVVAAWAFLGS